MRVNETVAIIITISILIVCFFTLGQFVLFLSSHTFLKYAYKYGVDSHKIIVHDGSVLMPLVWDFTLLSIFVLQHSLQANFRVKNFLHHNGLGVIERLLYNLGSCLALQVVMYFWQPIPAITLWEVLVSDHTFLWWFFSATHFISWLVIYSGCYIMDLTELLGVKQVYHYILKWPPPLHQKSDDLKRFYSHMRHPSFSGLIAILFIHPVMQLDRFLLAYILAIYMMLRFTVDENDYIYQRRMLHKKYRDLVLHN